MMPRNRDSGAALWTAFARSVRYNAVAEVFVQLVRVGGFVVLARALEPADFGLLRVLIAINALALLVCRMGFPEALIQRRELRREHQATGFWLVAVLAFVTSAVLYATGGVIADLMKMPALATSIHLICLPMLVEGTSGIANARLRRRLQFGALAAADVLPEIAFLASALIVLWVFKLPRWSLTAALAARLMVHGLLVWHADRYIPRQGPNASAMGDLWRFAVSVWSGSAIEAVSTNVDYILIGRLLGSAALGYYSMSWDLLRFIPDRLHRVAGRVTLPAFCQLQDRDDELGRAYRDFVSYIGRIVLPFVACAVVAAPEVIAGVYGKQWIPSATPLRLLSPGLALIGLRMGIGSIYYAKSRPSLDIYLHTGRLVLIAGAVLCLWRFGLFGVSLGVGIAETIISIAGIWLACRMVSVSVWRLGSAAMPGLKLAALCAAGTGLGKVAASTAGLREVLALPLVVIPPALILFILEGQTVIRFAKRSVAAPAS